MKSIAATALIATAIGTNFTGDLLLADTGDHARSLAVEASGAPASQGASVDAATAKRLFSEDARKLAEQQRVREAQAKRDAAMRLCFIKPVMSDDEIQACRVAYRDLGDSSK